MTNYASLSEFIRVLDRLDKLEEQHTQLKRDHHQDTPKIWHRLTRLEQQIKLREGLDNLEDLLRQEHDTHNRHIDRLLNLQGHMRRYPHRPEYLITTGEKEAIDYAIQQLQGP